MDKIKSFFITYKSDFIGILWMCFGCFAFGQILIAIIAGLDENPTSIPIGTIIMGIGSFGLLLLWGGMSLASKFNLQLSMGETRKSILFQYMVYLLISVVVIWGLNLVSLQLEKVIHLNILKLQPEGPKMYQVINDMFVGLGRVYLVAAGLSVLIGAANLRWGRVVFWIFYFVFIILCQVPNFINMKVKGEARVELYDGFTQFMLNGNLIQWIVCIAIALVCLCCSWLMLKKQRCTL